MDRGWVGAAASERRLLQRQNQYLQRSPIQVDADLGVLAGWLRMDIPSINSSMAFPPRASHNPNDPVDASSYLIKVVCETLATPLTYAGVAWLERREGVDAFDTETHINPFALRGLSAVSEVKAP
jgi:hypothetical protein